MSTDATGTPTSPDNIPTYNVDNDAPSGLGFNAAMAAIQTALSARASKPSGIVSGEVPVWNGSTWVRSSVTPIGPTSLGSGTPDATKFLRGDGSWQAVSNQKITTSTWAGGPPGSPADGDIWIATGIGPSSLIRWQFQYNSAAATYKWEFIGGAPVFLSDFAGTTRQNSADSIWEVMPSFPTFTTARGGQYRGRWGFTWNGNNNNSTYVTMGSGTNGAGLNSNAYPQINMGQSFGANLVMAFGGAADDALGGITRTAGQVLTLQMQTTAHTNVGLFNAWLEILPIHVI